MANPSVQKTWQFNLNGLALLDNTLSGNAHFDRRKTMLAIKNALKGFGTQPWTVTESSDSATATGNTDKWIDEGDLVWRDDDTGSAFSWIVLRQTAISTTFELLITCEQDSNVNDGAQIGAWVAQAGFMGGTTTARPMATDERQIRDSTAFGHWGTGGNGGTGLNIRWNVMQSTDGECTRVLFFMNNINTGLWFFEKPANPNSNWTTPYVASIQGDNNVTTEQATYAKYYDNAFGDSRFNGTDIQLYLSGEGFNSAAIGEQLTAPNQLDGNFIASEIGLCSRTSTVMGRIGEVFDLWWGFTSQETGRYFPSDASSKAFVQVRDMIFPWDGSTLIGTE